MSPTPPSTPSLTASAANAHGLPPLKLAHRFTESSFRNYEDSIKTIVDSWPEPVKFTPKNSLETFANRLRDAMRSFRTYHWKSNINWAKFEQVHDQIKVSIQGDGTVLAVDKKLNLQATSQVVKAIAERPHQTATLLFNPTEKAIEASMTLLMQNAIEAPIEIKNLDKSLHDLVMGLQDRFDCAVTTEGDVYKIY